MGTWKYVSVFPCPPRMLPRYNGAGASGAQRANGLARGAHRPRGTQGGRGNSAARLGAGGEAVLVAGGGGARGPGGVGAACGAGQGCRCLFAAVAAALVAGRNRALLRALDKPRTPWQGLPLPELVGYSFATACAGEVDSHAPAAG